jgi:hypothetical protein
VSQKKQKKIRNWHKVTLLETDSYVHLPTESNQVPALPRADKWPHGQTKEARVQAIVVLWKIMTSNSALIGSYPNQEVVQEEATPVEIPSDWTRIKLEPHC